MASEFGIGSESDTLQQLVFQDVIYHPLLIDSLVPCVVGQVVQYNTTNDNWDAYTSGMAASQYAVIAEGKTLSGDTKVSCVVKGSVRKSKLDSTAKADAEIDVALIKSGIIPVTDNVRAS